MNESERTGAETPADLEESGVALKEEPPLGEQVKQVHATGKAYMTKALRSEILRQIIDTPVSLKGKPEASKEDM